MLYEVITDMAEVIGEFAESGLVNLVGGCCGTTPAHIAALRNAYGFRVVEHQLLLRGIADAHIARWVLQACLLRAAASYNFV